MQRTDGVAKPTQRKLKSSTTLNRRYVERPSKQADVNVVVTRSPRIRHFKVESLDEVAPARTIKSVQQDKPAQKHPLQVSAINRMQTLRSQQVSTQQREEKKMTAKEIKDQAIKKALLAAAAQEETDDKQTSKMRSIGKMHFGFGRVALALSCAFVAALAIVYFVNLNMPDLSLRVAAMQTGINASYPGYIPMGYRPTSITSENKKILLEFKNKEKDGVFSLTEETSSWDSNALLNNYVKPTYQEDYKVVREQGLTIYINNSNAVWVNGGIFYEIKNLAGDGLTNKQICAIATSL